MFMMTTGCSTTLQQQREQDSHFIRKHPDAQIIDESHPREGRKSKERNKYGYDYKNIHGKEDCLFLDSSPKPMALADALIHYLLTNILIR